MEPQAIVHHYYVDEAGDLTLFDKQGRSLVGTEGVSKVFMVGVAHLPDPAAAHRELETLRAALLADPYFRSVPSMTLDGGKTASFFHAKDDLPEVRREVFRLLPSLGAKVQVAVRRKAEMAAQARIMFSRLGRKLPQNDVYDDLVKRLFRNVLHQADENRITFARRGKSPRQQALAQAIARAQENFLAKWGRPSDKPTKIDSAQPSQSAGLQVIDYFLWALQRLFERSEDRYFELLRSQYRLIMDLDDTRNHRYGEWYTDRNPLTLAKKKPVGG